MDIKILKKILSDLESGLAPWVKYPNTEIYKGKLERYNQFKAYIKEYKRYLKREGGDK